MEIDKMKKVKLEQNINIKKVENVQVDGAGGVKICRVRWRNSDYKQYNLLSTLS